MNRNMTLSTNRHNIKPVLRFIAFVMMILLGGLWAIMTEQKFRRNQFAILNGVIYSFNSFNFIWIESIKTFLGFFVFCCFLIFCNTIALNNSAFFCLFIFPSIFQITNFASIFISILVTCGFVKFVDWFSLFANATGFRYDYLNHNLSPIKVAVRADCSSQATVVGSSYYRRNQ